jgi:hypothetical protein
MVSCAPAHPILAGDQPSHDRAAVCRPKAHPGPFASISGIEPNRFGSASARTRDLVSAWGYDPAAPRIFITSGNASTAGQPARPWIKRDTAKDRGGVDAAGAHAPPKPPKRDAPIGWRLGDVDAADGPGGDADGHFGRALRRRRQREVADVHCGHLHVQVDAVEQGPGDLGLVLERAERRPRAGERGVVQVTAAPWARPYPGCD